MDGLEVAAAVETSSSLHGPSKLATCKPVEIQVAPRIKAALRTLLESLDYVADLDSNLWDFALEMSHMRHMKLTNSDLRWLVGKGLVECAIEITMAGDAHRSFRQPARPMFCKKTCFVLTPAGTAASRELLGRRETVRHSSGLASLEPAHLGRTLLPTVLTPSWDRDRQELKVGTILVKQFKVPAANQESILAAFEEESWPPRIDDPLPGHPEQSPKRRLQETIKSLNRNQKRSILRFFGDGSGQGVRWEFCDQFNGPHER